MHGTTETDAPGRDGLADALDPTAAVTGKVDEIMATISGQRLVDGSWLSDQLLDVSNLVPLTDVAGRAFAVVGELRGRNLVDRTWAVDQLLDLRTFAVEHRN